MKECCSKAVSACVADSCAISVGCTYCSVGFHPIRFQESDRSLFCMSTCHAVAANLRVGFSDIGRWRPISVDHLGYPRQD